MSSISKARKSFDIPCQEYHAREAGRSAGRTVFSRCRWPLVRGQENGVHGCELHCTHRPAFRKPACACSKTTTCRRPSSGMPLPRCSRSAVDRTRRRNIAKIATRQALCTSREDTSDIINSPFYRWKVLEVLYFLVVCAICV